MDVILCFFSQWQKDSIDREGRAVAAAAEGWCKDDEPCSGIMKKSIMLYKAVHEVHHKLPGFHEDYFGPRKHKPKHH